MKRIASVFVLAFFALGGQALAQSMPGGGGGGGITASSSDTLTNKTVDGDDNTLQDIGTSSLKTVQGNGTKVQLSTGTTTTGNCVEFDANGNTVDAGAACGTATLSLSSASPNIVVTPDPITGVGTTGATSPVDASQTGTTASLDTDYAGGLTVLGNASPVALTVAQAGTTGYEAGKSWGIVNNGAGLVTATSTTSVFKGAGGTTSFTLPQNTECWITSDGTDWVVDACTAYLSGTAVKTGTVAVANGGTGLASGTSGGVPYYSGSTTIASSGALAANALVIGGGAGSAPSTTTTGTGVLTALGVNTDTAGAFSTLIAKGTSALGTSAISSATCATVVTTSATGTATTDVILAGFNGDPTGVTGYAPSTSGMLTIIPYPSANNVNFKVCNNTSSSVTPGAITLNWRVIR